MGITTMTGTISSQENPQLIVAKNASDENSIQSRADSANAARASRRAPYTILFYSFLFFVLGKRDGDSRNCTAGRCVGDVERLVNSVELMKTSAGV